eukprot:15340533-Ditylum_brightwellii.AAC.1
MNDSALYEYIKAAILALYPDISDETGKCVIAKIDGGPGQEQDWPCVLFKSLVRKVIGLLCAEYYSEKDEQGKVRQINRSDYGVIINGQEGTADKEPIVSLFIVSFTTEINKNAWKAIGVCPLKRNCKAHSSVHHEVPVAPSFDLLNLSLNQQSLVNDSPFEITSECCTPEEHGLHLLKQKNIQFVRELYKNGYKGSAFEEDAPREVGSVVRLHKEKDSNKRI